MQIIILICILSFVFIRVICLMTPIKYILPPIRTQYNEYRINMLSPDTKPLWGKMYPDQMLAHVNQAYEMPFENLHPKPKEFKKLILKLFVKKQSHGLSSMLRTPEQRPYLSLNFLMILKLNKID